MEQIKKELIEHGIDLMRVLTMLETARDDIEKGEDEAPCFFPIVSSKEIDEVIGQGEIYLTTLGSLINKIERRTKK